MVSNEKFCLRWNDFESNISVAFRELREEKDFFDVTLACDDSQVEAHKVILSACSPFFRSILKKNPHQHPLLYLKGVKFKELVSVLNFMYMGEVNVAQEELNSFLSVAEELRVKGLTQNNADAATSHSKSEKSGRVRDPPPEREQGPPPKKSRPAPPPVHNAVPVSAASIPDDDIQEVVPVKSEPREVVSIGRDINQDYDNTNQQGTVAIQDYQVQEDGYDYEGYEEGYDDGSYDTSGMQAGAADGNKVRKVPSTLKKIPSHVRRNPSSNYSPTPTQAPYSPAPTPAPVTANNCLLAPPPGTGNILIKEELDLGPGSVPDDDEEDVDGDTRWDVEMESRISLDLNLFVCMACAGSKYSSKQKINIITHIKTKHLTEFAGFICELCPQVFNRRRNFERHMQRLHNVLTVSTEVVKSEDSIAE